MIQKRLLQDNNNNSYFVQGRHNGLIIAGFDELCNLERLLLALHQFRVVNLRRQRRSQGLLLAELCNRSA